MAIGAPAPAAASVDNLNVICSGFQGAVVDIISIPSLPQLLPSYQPRDEAKWIRNVFTHHFPSARVVSFRYDFARGETDACWSRILQEGTSLLYSLVHLRSNSSEMNRPLVFLCHSFGGMVLKQALVAATQNVEFRSIFDSTIGILFFGCIHDHSPADFETCCLKCAAVEMCIPLAKHEITLSLRSSDKWSLLRQTLDDFKQLIVPFPIWSFVAGRKTSYKQYKLRPGGSSLICPESLSRLNVENEQLLTVDMDHIQLSSFPTRSHPLFQKIITVIDNILLEHQNRESRDTDAGVSLHDFPLAMHHADSSSTSGIDTPASNQIPDDLRFSQEPVLLKLPCRSQIPCKENPNFVGRSAILSRMGQCLVPASQQQAKQNIFALCGLGGLGKTQTAVRFTKMHMASYQAVLFAHAGETTSLLDDFSRFAIDLGLVGADEPNQKLSGEKLKTWFETTDVPWLLVFDNADKSAVLDEFWPQCANGSILVTSRTKTLATELGGEILQPLHENDAVDLLFALTRPGLGPGQVNNEGRAVDNEAYDCEDSKTAAKQEKEFAVSIVRRLGCLPLGVLQAANIIVQDSCLLSDFIAAYGYRDLLVGVGQSRVFNNPNKDSYRHTLSTVWSMNFDSLSRDSQVLLSVLSLFNPDTIQLEMLAKGAEKASRAGYDKWSMLDNTKKLTKCKASILQSSLVEQNPATRTLSMHRLVQEASQDRMSDEDRQDAFDMAVCLLDNEWPVPPRNNRLDVRFWPRQQPLLPHILSVCEFYDESRSNGVPLLASKPFAELLHNVARYIYERGYFEHAEPLLHISEAYCLTHEGCDLVLAEVYGARGAIANQINRRQTALKYFEQQYECIKNAMENGSLTEPDIRICFALGGLGNGHQGMNHYDEAVQWYHKCFDAWEGVEGDQRLYAANLAFCLCWQGKPDEAEEVLKPWIRPPEDTSFRAAGVMFVLGNIEIARGALDKAWEMHMHTFRAYKLHLGEKHHKTADIYHKIGWHYHARKEYKNAVELLKQALTVYETCPDWYPNEIARTKYKLGCVLQDSGLFVDGTSLIKEAEALRRQLLGDDVQPGDERSFDELVMFWSR